MADFDDELNSYIQARSASDHKEKQDSAAANAAADAVFGHAFPFPHPEGFQPTQDAPAFALHPVSNMWHDATTGTYSYYDAATETYIPVEEPYHGHTTATIPVAYDSNPVYHIDPSTGYAVEVNGYGYGDSAQNHYEAPPESDATLRLCVLSSNILKVGGVIMMDASGLSFGRDRPLSGQGKRVRMVEMEISRFHASVYLDRQQVVQEDHTQDKRASSPGAVTASAEEESYAGNKENDKVEKAESRQDDEEEEGEYSESPGAGARDAALVEPEGTNQEEEEENGEINEQQQQSEQYRDYQRQIEEYQQHYQAMTLPVLMDTFQITDCGSTHGTFLNGERLSAARTASQPFQLNHMDQLQMGTTVFEIHAHADGRICGTCQVTEDNEIEVLDDKDRDAAARVKDGADSTGKGSPALSSTWTGDVKLAMERERVEEMNRLKKKWAGPDKKAGHTKRAAHRDSSLPRNPEAGEAPREYVDRAAKRRLYNPDRSSPVLSAVPVYAPQEVASGFHVPVAKTNKGHAMLSKMGWKAGTGLGAARQGVVEPVQLMVSDRKAGLGSGALKSQGAAAVASSETAAEAARRKARERYAQLK
ncbi:Angiogenic factor with G patch and FHA domains 1 [Dissophora ornata]|nr:Angiogenic factor with G patch and FHA domains 1 [Dissophora ornata]